MLASTARAAILRRCRSQAAKAVRAMSAPAPAEFDLTGKSEEEMEAEIASLELPAGLPIIKETEEGFEISTGNEKEFNASLHEYAVYNEGLSDPGRSPWAEALGLDFAKKLTLVSYFGLTALSKEWYVMNEETVIAMCFVGALTSVYAFGGNAMADMYEEYKARTITEQNAAEDAHIAACKNVLYGFPTENIQSSLDAVFDEEKSVIEAEAKARVIQEKNDLIKNYQTTLDKLVIAQSEAANKEYQAMLGQTVEAVAEAAKDAAFKKEALKYALDAAAGKDVGENPTVALYAKILGGLQK